MLATCAWPGPPRRISPGRGPAASSTGGVAGETSGSAGAAGCAGFTVAGGAAVRRFSGLNGCTGIPGPDCFGRSGRTTGGGKRSAAELRSAAIGCAGTTAAAGASTRPGIAGTAGAAGGGTTTCAAGGISGSRGASAATGSGAGLASFSSSCRKGECRASVGGRSLIGGGSIGLAEALLRLLSPSGSLPPRGGVTGLTVRRRAGGRGGAIGRSFPLLGIGGGSVGTDFLVSDFNTGCGLWTGGGTAGEVTRTGADSGPSSGAGAVRSAGAAVDGGFRLSPILGAVALGLGDALAATTWLGGTAITVSFARTRCPASSAIAAFAALTLSDFLGDSLCPPDSSVSELSTESWPARRSLTSDTTSSSIVLECVFFS